MYIKKEIQDIYDALELEIEKYLKNFDKKILKKAFNFAYKNFINKTTYYGEEKIVHLLKISLKLTSLQASIATIIAGLLHSYKINENNKEDFEKIFGKDVTKIVIGVNKITDIKYKKGMTTRDINFLKEIFRIGGNDLRVLFVKIAEKIDGIKNIEKLPKDVRKNYAIEVMDIYSPMVKIFGIGKFFGNIEDVCYKYIYPEEYKDISKIIKNKREKLEKKLEGIKIKISSLLKEGNIDAKIESRIKSISSIARKIKEKGISIPLMFDLIALRVITNNKKDAYIALGLIHSYFKVRGKRIKDYISAPKSNGYQSLHTTLSDNEGHFFEVQIQTKEMYKLNSFGLASHIGYKGFSINNASLPKWMLEILKNQKNQLFGEKFINSLNINSLKETISCKTTFGEIIELPKGSTILDFVFNLHTDIGKFVVGAWVNGVYYENLIFTLSDGDIVKLDIGEKESNYNVAFLSYVRTDIAKKHIKDLLKNQSKEKRILLGEHLLNEKLKFLGYKKFIKMSDFIKNAVFNKMKVKDSQLLFLEIGGGNIDANKVIDLIYVIGDEKNKYESTISIKINFKKKDHNNIYLISNVFHNLDVNIQNIIYKGLLIIAEVNVKDFKNLQELLSELSRVPNVISVKRQLTNKNILFFTIILFTGFFIGISPFALFFIDNFFHLSKGIYETIFYINVFFFISILYLFKYIVNSTLKGLINQNIFWSSMGILNTITLITLTIESFYIFDTKNIIFFFSLVLVLYGLTLFEYIDSKISKKD